MLFLLVSPFVIALLFFLPRRFRIPTWLMKLWKTLGDHIFGVFLAIACLSSIPFFINGASVGEDIGSQVKSSLQWANGNVPAPNFVKQPNPNDLSSDREVWVLRPPGGLLAPHTRDANGLFTRCFHSNWPLVLRNRWWCRLAFSLNE